jgi:hypothetical protein
MPARLDEDELVVVIVFLLLGHRTSREARTRFRTRSADNAR